MGLSALQKSQIRRHLKYGNVGFSSASAGGGGGTLGTNQSLWSSSYNGLLEVKMNSLQPCDEATLIGKAFGSIQFIGLPPENGDSVSIMFSNFEDVTPLSSPYTMTVTCGVDQAGDLSKFALLVASQISRDTTLAAAGFKALTPYGPGSNVLDPVAEIGIVNRKAFNLQATATGAFAAAIEDTGNEAPEPVAEVGKQAGVPIVVRGYLPLLNYLYGAIASSTRRLGTRKADVFEARVDEIDQRMRLYDLFRRDMATFLEVPLSRHAAGGKGTYGQIQR